MSRLIVWLLDEIPRGLFWLLVGGVVMVMTGFAPDHWAAKVIEIIFTNATRYEWITGWEFRLGVVVIGVAVITIAVLVGRSRTKQAHGSGARRISARQAIQYMVHKSRWGWRQWLSLRGGHPEGLSELFAMDRFRRAAQQQVISVRGRHWDRQEHEDIDPDMWSRIQLRPSSILDDTNNSGETEPATLDAVQPLTFSQLSVDVSDVSNAWPKAGFIYRFTIRTTLALIYIWWWALWPIEYLCRKWEEWHAGNT